MIVPEPALAPVIPPVTVPSVQAKVLGTLEVRLILGLAPLQIVALAGLVTVGDGVIVNVIVNGVPIQVPAIEVGVTMYSMVPGADGLGLFKTWLIVDPEPAIAPVIPPLLVPIIQVKVEAIEAVSERLVLAPLQILAAAELVITGAGLTVTVIVKGDPVQEPAIEVGTTMNSTVPGIVLLGLVST